MNENPCDDLPLLEDATRPMQCCRCGLRLDTGHNTNGGIHLFWGGVFCKCCLVQDPGWVTAVKDRLHHYQESQKYAGKLQCQSPIMRRFLRDIVVPGGLDTLAKTKARMLEISKFQGTWVM